jgi:catechol 2,3-dioxygenase-like lactoylglutathione lyase family enzyme
MASSLGSIGAITLFVEDVARSKAWYLRVFERPLVYEDSDSAVIKFENTIVNLLQLAEARTLIAPATVADGEAGARTQFTIWVDDADATCADLHERGVVLINGPMDREWGQRTACFADPDGHVWEVAQAIAE